MGGVDREMSEIWPNIGERTDAMPDAEKMRNESGKFEKYFSKAREKSVIFLNR